MRQWTEAWWSKLSPLLDQALDLEAGDRGAFIATVRADDPDVASALEQLLLQHERVIASSFLESPPLVDSPPVSLAGQTIGAYTLERPLGMGGMGTVWLARRSDGRFEGSVAIKFVNFAVLDLAGQDRFRREGTLLARLSHPNIARLHDAGVTPGGQPFLVLEYVEGERIDEYAAERRLGIDARLELFLQVADAVAHAHANLVVHRDLKPSNVLVDTHGQVKLLDFGIATLVDAGSPDGSATITATAAALTPEYAAPEQIAGGPVTTATDVYALGVLLYQLIVGRHPTATADATHAAVLRALAEQEPVHLSDAVSRMTNGDADAARILSERCTTRERLRRACRGDLDTILAKALKKAPGERYQTVTAFADDLRRHLRREPVTARPDSVLYRTRRFAARHRLEFGAAAAIFVALVAGTAIAVRQARASARERDRALEELRRAEASNEFSSFLLAQARPSGAPISNKALLARGEALIDKRFAADPALRVHMLLAMADRYQENQQFDDRRRVLKRAYDDATSIPDAALRADATCAWAQVLSESGDAKRALDLIAAVERGLSSIPEHRDVRARCLVYESISARTAGDAPRAIAAAEAALSLVDGRAPSTRLFDALAALSSAYGIGSRVDDAARTYRRAMDVLDAQGLGDSLDAAVVLNNWSVALQDAGRSIDAVDVSARAVATARAADSEHGASMTMLSTYANVLTAVGSHAAAARVFDEALEKVRASGSPRRLITTSSFAIVNALALGDLDAAARMLAEAERARTTDPSAYSRGLVELSTARVALARHQVRDAMAAAHRAVATLETATPNQASLQVALIWLAQSLNAGGRFAEALAASERSLELARRRLADQRHSSGMGQALLEIAVAKRGLGELKMADEASALALEHLLATVGPDADATVRAKAFRATGGKAR